MPFARSHGADIYWKVEGRTDSPALVLLNSIGTDMDLWDAALPMLRERFCLLRIDARGHGASDAPTGDYSLSMLADDVATTMDAAGIARAAVAGVSLGGMVAMELALQAPQRVTALALVCTSATMDSASWDARIAKIRGEGMASIADLVMGRFLSPVFCAQHPATAATVLRGLLMMAPAGYAGCGAAIRDMALVDRLGAMPVPVPTLVVTGIRDTSTPFEGHGEHLLSAIPNAKHVGIEAAHLAPIEAPHAVSTALIDFFSN
ncbi:3-oxoadipate enol-lactonase [Sphingobium sp. AR-3-1]|uniref:3-oxoadipate enol-lactonase n=1 Tax=Sphingobium psychrophilum TaxID=2728834 RepID=A0A7X9ZTB4_9SPHN|nr:3-oxoadipate enol-lactonase [Sphingobium psychrophilum]NML11980.1 3-oxoadipate enol-lactonase [Sphingobium psychrophilum]